MRRFSYITFLLIAIWLGCDGNKADERIVFIPAGRFLMGSELSGDNTDQKPAHNVYLDSFYIDKYEVTNMEYSRFIAENGYKRKEFWSEEGWKFIQKNNIQERREVHNPLFNAPDQPVIGVSWYEAEAYTRWAGKRLPTEAEWEKAARGTDGRIYPWGNELIFDNFFYRISLIQRTHPVDSFVKGASPYSVLAMAGNVWEWVADWYDANYYSKSPERNPGGPETGEYHILRGGGWGSTRMQIRTTYRYFLKPESRELNVGFRCVAYR